MYNLFLDMYRCVFGITPFTARRVRFHPKTRSDSLGILRCLSVLNVHFCKKSPKLAHMTFDRYLSNPDIGRTFWGGLTPSN